jgi:uncharacterized protein YndB with AHSA1/START domain
MSTTSSAPASSATTLRIVRTFDAPRELVFRAWTEQAMMEKWSCPIGFVSVSTSGDVRVGGQWRESMRDPQGKVHTAGGVYREIVRPEKLVFTHAWEDENGKGGAGHESLVTVTLAESNGRTTMTFLQEGLKSAESRDGHEEGWTEAFDKLTALVGDSLGVTSSHTTDRELVFTRVYNAPRTLVWRAWADPKQMVQWWGPNGFSTTMEKWDLRVGGVRKYVMHGPDGANYPNSGVFTEVVENERMAWRHGGAREGGPGVSFTSTATFEDAGTGTRVTLRMAFPTAEDKQLVMREYGAEEGGKQTLTRLAGYLPAMTSKPFTISRTFDAPIDIVWRAWTDPARLAQWWGPKGVTSNIKTFDLKPSGVWHCSLQAPGQPVYWGKYVFREVTPKSRLVFVVSFSNEKGEIVKHPLSADWPAEILSTVEFAPEGNGKTNITVTWTPINANETERRTFSDGAQSMRGGWTGTFDQLDAFLAGSKA